MFLDYLRQAGAAFSVGFKVTGPVRDAIRALPADAWELTTRQDGSVRDGAAVAELTDTLRLGGWPQPGSTAGPVSRRVELTWKCLLNWDDAGYQT